MYEFYCLYIYIYTYTHIYITVENNTHL